MYLSLYIYIYIHTIISLSIYLYVHIHTHTSTAQAYSNLGDRAPLPDVGGDARRHVLLDGSRRLLRVATLIINVIMFY